MLQQLANNTSSPFMPYAELSEEQVIDEIYRLKEVLSDQVLFLGHHYQQDDIIQFADLTGDSLKLARDAAHITKPYTIFCGVHFMAETADMLTKEDQHVLLPDMRAGCTMADMANHKQVQRAWDHISGITDDKIVPITYINCTAHLKAFVGKHDGSICTSSNAEKIISWALENGEKLFFFPDQHLGRNTCEKLGISLEDMIVYNPLMLNGGVTDEQIKKAKVILWYGHCSVHQGFTKEHIDDLRTKRPDVQIIVHPECSFDVVKNADDDGSTAYIIDKITNAPSGTSFAVGTEINLVNRLNKQFPDKEIFSLSPYQCLCTTMYRVRPHWLLQSLKSIQEDKPINIIKVDANIRSLSLKALETMLELS